MNAGPEPVGATELGRAHAAGTPPAACRWPCALLGSLALICLIESSLSWHVTSFLHFASLAWRTSGRAASARSVAECDVLLLGDSLVKSGLLPRVLEAELGCRAYNLAVFAGQAPSSFFLLRKALEAGARPSAIVVDFHPNLMAVSPRSNVPLWSHLLDMRDGLDLAWSTLDVRLAFETLALGWLPSIRDRLDLRKAILASVAFSAPQAGSEGPALMRNWRLNRGAHVAAVAATLAPDPYAGSSNQRGVWKPRPVNVRYAERLLDLAASRGITVYWLMPPSTRAWQAKRELRGLDAPYERNVSELLERHGNLVVLDGRHSCYDDRAFHDPSHLNLQGAASLSRSTAQILARHQQNPQAAARWEHMPGFQEYPVSFVVEDIAQSKLAVSLGKPYPSTNGVQPARLWAKLKPGPPAALVR